MSSTIVSTPPGHRRFSTATAQNLLSASKTGRRATPLHGEHGEPPSSNRRRSLIFTMSVPDATDEILHARSNSHQIILTEEQLNTPPTIPPLETFLVLPLSTAELPRLKGPVSPVARQRSAPTTPILLLCMHW
ncbi:hypothetical protein B0H17DRAFT_1133060 [Mycena rosella]|uniref:Uncharacterized protein n=1 Tax=Mycena rosella TaxID=1033263 RepID=A0AAD7DLT7_MYCRO|nr:hypothetical protein B0H17DRAFT_1133060 [Mycena rosella]